MNPDLELLQAYPFEKLRRLFSGLQPPAELPPINLGIGEPQHPAPDFVVAELSEHLPLLAKYPATRGLPELRQSIAAWLQRRFQLPTVNAETQVLPVAGTREALFAIAQAVCDRSGRPLVLCPNPFYQIYEGATLLAGARVCFLDCRSETDFLPDFDAVGEDSWRRCQLLYICTPGTPTGAVIPQPTLTRLVELAQQYDFVIASDECYSEIYRDEDQPPPGLLQASIAAGVDDYHNCVVFHSLSKRSNLPGLRSGFVAGDGALLERFLLYRTYQGCALPLPTQWASVAAWSDEDHVRTNRALYREKFSAVLEILEGRLQLQSPQAGFYLWPDTPVSDTEFASGLFAQQHLTVLPGSFLGRDGGAGNPGDDHVRLALVAPLDQCIEAAQRIRHHCEAL
jgi:N-succinyldiaminopimelate aminotransferase